MKALFITLGFTFCIFSGFRASSQYLETMKENIDALYAAETMEGLQAVVNKFERIAQAEEQEWHPLYYAAFGYIMMSTRAETVNDKDDYLDKARAVLKQAKDRKPGESELVALEGFIDMIRVTVDPATRGAQYSGMAMEAFHKAVQMNPENPRAMYLLAQMQIGTARFFGSDISDGCASLDKAITLFENYEPAHPLDPAWGFDDARRVKEQCN